MMRMRRAAADLFTPSICVDVDEGTPPQCRCPTSQCSVSRQPAYSRRAGPTEDRHRVYNGHLGLQTGLADHSWWTLGSVGTSPIFIDTLATQHMGIAVCHCLYLPGSTAYTGLLGVPAWTAPTGHRSCTLSRWQIHFLSSCWHLSQQLSWKCTLWTSIITTSTEAPWSVRMRE